MTFNLIHKIVFMIAIPQIQGQAILLPSQCARLAEQKHRIRSIIHETSSQADQIDEMTWFNDQINRTRAKQTVLSRL
jgi:hypothetical protein